MAAKGRFGAGGRCQNHGDMTEPALSYFVQVAVVVHHEEHGAEPRKSKINCNHPYLAQEMG